MAPPRAGRAGPDDLRPSAPTSTLSLAPSTWLNRTPRSVTCHATIKQRQTSDGVHLEINRSTTPCGEKKEPEILGKTDLKNLRKNKQKAQAVSFPTPTCQHQKHPERPVRPTLQRNRARPKKNSGTDASAAETHAGMNRSTNPLHGGVDSSSSAAAAATRRIHEQAPARTDAESNSN